MSTTEINRGRFKIVIKRSDPELELKCKAICEANDITTMAEYDSYEQCLINELYETYFSCDIGIGKVLEMESSYDYDEIFHVSKSNQDTDTYEFILQYYNGGCSFNEAIQTALDRMNKKIDYNDLY